MILATTMPNFRATVTIKPVEDMKIHNAYQKPLLGKKGAWAILILWAIITLMYYV